MITGLVLLSILVLPLSPQSTPLQAPAGQSGGRTPVAPLGGGAESLQAGGGVPNGSMILRETQISPPGYLFAGLSLYATTVSPSWSTKPSMPTARFGCQAGVMNGRLYVVGGAINACGRTGAVEAFDPATNAWTTGYAPMPTAREGFGAGVVNGVFYAVGGATGCGPLTTAVEAYDPNSNTWTTKSALPSPQYLLSAGVVNGILYAVGGFNGAPLNLNRAYDPATDTWSTKAPMPTARYAHAVATVNGILYVLGGGDGTAAVLPVEAYDPATDTWSTGSPMPSGLAFNKGAINAATINGIIYVVGGTNSVGTITAAVQAYDPATGSWTSVSSMQTARSDLAVGAINGVLYAVGGAQAGPTFLSTVEQLVTGRTLYAHQKN